MGDPFRVDEPHVVLTAGRTDLRLLRGDPYRVDGPHVVLTAGRTDLRLLRGAPFRVVITPYLFIRRSYRPAVRKTLKGSPLSTRSGGFEIRPL